MKTIRQLSLTCAIVLAFGPAIADEAIKSETARAGIMVATPVKSPAPIMAGNPQPVIIKNYADWKNACAKLSPSDCGQFGVGFDNLNYPVATSGKRLMAVENNLISGIFSTKEEAIGNDPGSIMYVCKNTSGYFRIVWGAKKFYVCTVSSNSCVPLINYSLIPMYDSTLECSELITNKNFPHIISAQQSTIK